MLGMEASGSAIFSYAIDLIQRNIKYEFYF